LGPIAGALAHVEIELGTETIAVALRVRPVQQRDPVEDVAVQHRDGAAVLHVLNGVKQERRRHAVEREVHPRERASADRELAAEVVARGHAREHLDCSHRIVGQQVAQVLDVGASQRHLGGYRFFLLPEALAGNGDRFRVGARAFTERHGELDGPAADDVDGPFHQNEADDRHVERSASRRNVGQLEPSLGVRLGRLLRILQLHGHVRDGCAVGAIDHDAANRAGSLRRLRPTGRCDQAHARAPKSSSPA
jgi:hypothetical protein